MGDTTRLSAVDRALFVSARQKSDGSIEVELEDRHAARQELHKLLGLIVNRSEGKQLNVSLDLSTPSPEQAQLMSPAQLIAALWRPAKPAALPAPADPVVAQP